MNSPLRDCDRLPGEHTHMQLSGMTFDATDRQPIDIVIPNADCVFQGVHESSQS
jgi:hypothetical protein